MPFSAYEVVFKPVVAPRALRAKGQVHTRAVPGRGSTAVKVTSVVGGPDGPPATGPGGPPVTATLISPRVIALDSG